MEDVVVVERHRVQYYHVWMWWLLGGTGCNAIMGVAHRPWRT